MNNNKNNYDCRFYKFFIILIFIILINIVIIYFYNNYKNNKLKDKILSSLISDPKSYLEKHKKTQLTTMNISKFPIPDKFQDDYFKLNDKNKEIIDRNCYQNNRKIFESIDLKCFKNGIFVPSINDNDKIKGGSLQTRYIDRTVNLVKKTLEKNMNTMETDLKKQMEVIFGAGKKNNESSERKSTISDKILEETNKLEQKLEKEKKEREELKEEHKNLEFQNNELKSEIKELYYQSEHISDSNINIDTNNQYIPKIEEIIEELDKKKIKLETQITNSEKELSKIDLNNAISFLTEKVDKELVMNLLSNNTINVDDNKTILQKLQLKIQTELNSVEKRNDKSPSITQSKLETLIQNAINQFKIKLYNYLILKIKDKLEFNEFEKKNNILEKENEILVSTKEKLESLLNELNKTFKNIKLKTNDSEISSENINFLVENIELLNETLNNFKKETEDFEFTFTYSEEKLQNLVEQIKKNTNSYKYIEDLKSIINELNNIIKTFQKKEKDLSDKFYKLFVQFITGNKNLFDDENKHLETLHEYLESYQKLFKIYLSSDTNLNMKNSKNLENKLKENQTNLETFKKQSTFSAKLDDENLKLQDLQDLQNLQNLQNLDDFEEEFNDLDLDNLKLLNDLDLDNLKLLKDFDLDKLKTQQEQPQFVEELKKIISHLKNKIIEILNLVKEEKQKKENLIIDHQEQIKQYYQTFYDTFKDFLDENEKTLDENENENNMETLKTYLESYKKLLFNFLGENTEFNSVNIQKLNEQAKFFKEEYEELQDKVKEIKEIEELSIENLFPKEVLEKLKNKILELSKQNKNTTTDLQNKLDKLEESKRKQMIELYKKITDKEINNDNDKEIELEKLEKEIFEEIEMYKKYKTQIENLKSMDFKNLLLNYDSSNTIEIEKFESFKQFETMYNSKIEEISNLSENENFETYINKCIEIIFLMFHQIGDKYKNLEELKNKLEEEILKSLIYMNFGQFKKYLNENKNKDEKSIQYKLSKALQQVDNYYDMFLLNLKIKTINTNYEYDGNQQITDEKYSSNIDIDYNKITKFTIEDELKEQFLKKLENINENENTQFLAKQNDKENIIDSPKLFDRTKFELLKHIMSVENTQKALNAIKQDLDNYNNTNDNDEFTDPSDLLDDDGEISLKKPEIGKVTKNNNKGQSSNLLKNAANLYTNTSSFTGGKNISKNTIFKKIFNLFSIFDYDSKNKIIKGGLVDDLNEINDLYNEIVKLSEIIFDDIKNNKNTNENFEKFEKIKDKIRELVLRNKFNNNNETLNSINELNKKLLYTEIINKIKTTENIDELKQMLKNKKYKNYKEMIEEKINAVETAKKLAQEQLREKQEAERKRKEEEERKLKLQQEEEERKLKLQQQEEERKLKLQQKKEEEKKRKEELLINTIETTENIDKLKQMLNNEQYQNYKQMIKEKIQELKDYVKVYFGNKENTSGLIENKEDKEIYNKMIKHMLDIETISDDEINSLTTNITLTEFSKNKLLKNQELTKKEYINILFHLKVMIKSKVMKEIIDEFFRDRKLLRTSTNLFNVLRDTFFDYYEQNDFEIKERNFKIEENKLFFSIIYASTKNLIKDTFELLLKESFYLNNYSSLEINKWKDFTFQKFEFIIDLYTGKKDHLKLLIELLRYFFNSLNSTNKNYKSYKQKNKIKEFLFYLKSLLNYIKKINNASSMLGNQNQNQNQIKGIRMDGMIYQYVKFIIEIIYYEFVNRKKNVKYENAEYILSKIIDFNQKDNNKPTAERISTLSYQQKKSKNLFDMNEEIYDTSFLLGGENENKSSFIGYIANFFGY